MMMGLGIWATGCVVFALAGASVPHVDGEIDDSAVNPWLAALGCLLWPIALIVVGAWVMREKRRKRR